MEEQKIKAVAYSRVSSKAQEKKGFSIPAQKKLYRQYAQDNNIEIVAEFSEAETAKQSGRTEFNNMLKYLKKHPNITNILVEKTDRLYRNFNDYVTIDEGIYTIHLIKEGKTISPNSSSTAKLEHGFKVLIAKNYIDNLREETQKGRFQKIEEGYFIGQVPYGYMKTGDKKTTIFHPQRSKFVKRAFELYAKNNISLRALRQKMYDEGYFYLPSSPKISVAQLERMLKNDCYTGLLRYNGKLYHGNHDPLVSNKIFADVQKAFKKDNKPDTMGKHNYLYKKLIKCGNCGKTITAEQSKGHIYYHCTGDYGKCQCKSIFIPEETLDKQFSEAIKSITIDDRLADYLNLLLKDTYKEMQITTKEKAEYMQREVSAIKTRMDKLLDTFIDGNINKVIYDKKYHELSNQLEKLEEKIKINNSGDKEFINEGQKIIEQAKCLHSVYLKQNKEEKQKMLKTIFQNLWLDGQNLHYTLKKPFCYFTEMADFNKKLPRLDSNQQPTG